MAGTEIQGLHAEALEVSAGTNTLGLHSEALETMVGTGSLGVHSEALEAPVGTKVLSFMTEVLETNVLPPVVVPPTPPDPPTPLSSLTLPIENNVNPTNKYAPLTGLYSVEESIDGWIWDRRRVENELFPQTRHDTFLGGHEAGLLDGTKLEHWETGSNRGTEYWDLAHYRTGEFLTWTPRVEVGAYSLYHDRRPLFSDYSFSSFFRTDVLSNGVMWHALRSDALISTIDVAIYERDTLSRIFRKTFFKHVDAFTGSFSGTARLATTNAAGDVLWDNLETRKDEFIVEDSTVYLNDDHSIAVGFGDTTLALSNMDPDSFEDIFEPAGLGIMSGRDLFTKMFPVQPDSLRVIARNPADVVTEWTEQPNLDFSEPTDQHFSVDYDLGIVTMSGFQAPNLVLEEAVDDESTEVTVYIDSETMSQYPEQGVITIGTEEIAYYSRTRTTFYNLLRGYNSTTAASHAVGAVVGDRRHGLGTEDELFLSYTAVPRIDYEVTEHNLRSANKTGWLDIRPGVNVETHNILQILSTNVNLQTVELETDVALIGGEIHGPVFFGTDVARMTARGLDALGNPVEDIELTISILGGPGSLNGATTSFTDISNTLGEIYALYNAPYDKNDIEKLVSSTTNVGGNTQMVVTDLLSNTPTSDIWVSQVLKHDKSTGTVGEQLEVSLAAASGVGFVGISPGYIEVIGLVDAEDFKDGHLIVVGTDAVSYVRNIVTITEELDGSDQPYSRIYMDNTLATAIVAGQTVRLYEPDAVTFNSGALNGSRHILYELRSDVIHPITGELGAYYPLQPDSISGNVITFNNRSLPIPDKDDPTNNLAAYVVVAVGRASMQASGRDPSSGRVILSNIIRVELELPSTLVGVDTSGALPIPTGWRLVTEENNAGSGIGGANFITINPAADGINQFNVMGVFP